MFLTIFLHVLGYKSVESWIFLYTIECLGSQTHRPKSDSSPFVCIYNNYTVNK